MSLTIQVSVDDQATPRLRELYAALEDGREAHQYMADRATALVQRHFTALAGTNRNPYGARSTFWNRMVSGTAAQATGEAAFVRMPREIAQRYLGGPIEPKAGKTFLAIPARSEAHGKSPRQFDDLHFVPTGPEKGMLVQNEQTSIRIGKARKDGSRGVKAGREMGGLVMYWMVKSVWQDGDENVLPENDAFAGAAKEGLAAYFERAA
jgi:hypothetical protein